MNRLNKVLAQAGIASRRGADALIAAGRITVNGAVVTDLGRQVDPAVDEIRLDGEPVDPRRAQHTYLALHKPRGVVTTVSDPQGRPTVLDYVPREVRLFPVGRLDLASEGLVLLTDDGDLAQRLTHPRFSQPKEYRVKISGTPPETTLAAWREGVWLEDGRTAPAEVRLESTTGAGTWLRFVLREGRNRQIRRMIEPFHHTVHRLIRVRIGPVTLGDLAPGAWRALTPAELAALTGEGEAGAGGAGRKAARGGSAGGQPKYRPGWARPKPPKRKPGKGPRAGGARSAGRGTGAGRTGGTRAGRKPTPRRRDAGARGGAKAHR